jgi:hypothetical protein
MKYVCLCYDEEKKLKAMPKNEWDAIVREVHTTNEELRKKGHLISAQALQSVQTATTVRVRDGKPMVTDGPFVETREQIAGYFLVNAKDLNEAISIATRVPGARIGTVEVRPLIEITGLPE